MAFDRDLLSNALPAYDIGDELGKGGMGVVVSGQHRQLDRRVAIKQLPVSVAADPEIRRRFTAEARVLASLDHPHLVPVYDFVEREDVCLLVMEFLPGGTLRHRVAAAGGFTAPHAVAVTLACTSGLSAAHRRGILHRDVKPENMLFATSGVLKVADFGIAKVLGGAGTAITKLGEVIGTPAYIAPEQVRGGSLGPATDMYAVATMLYELLAGQLPFSGEGDDLALLFKHAYEKPVPLRDAAPGVPEAVAGVVMRGLATEPADRFGTAEDFGVALAGAAAEAWGPGWLAAEQVPIMDAGAIIGAAGLTTSPPRRAAATVSVAPPGSVPVTGDRGNPLSHAPTLGPDGVAAVTGTSGAPGTIVTSGTAVTGGTAAVAGAAGATGAVAGPAVAGPGVAGAVAGSEAADATAADAAAASAAARRRRNIIVGVVVVVLIIIIAIFVLPKLFHTYSGGLGPLPARLIRAQLIQIGRT
jgi:serine/threonine-protein kinase